MNLSDDKKFLNALLCAPGVGYETMSRFKKFFSSYEEAWRADMRELTVAGIAEKTADGIMQARKNIDPDNEMAHLSKEGTTLLETDEPDFPLLLKEIPSPPQWLYLKGSMSDKETAIAVVGSRKATSYGREAAERIISGLAEMTDATIVSGLAIGIDSEAHRSALRHGAKTIAVIGSGLDKSSFYPPQNIRLAGEIVEKGGAVISEYPLGMPAFKQNFIQRNRVISGLARGTLIVEAAEKSGALITARFALEQGREVFAVPGSIFSPYSKGVHALLKEGAVPVSSAEDIIDELNLPKKISFKNSEAALTDEKEKNILSHLAEPRRIDELKVSLNINTPDIIASLSMLELKGLVKNLGNGFWTRMHK